MKVSGVQANVIVKIPNLEFPGATEVFSASFVAVTAIGVQPDGAATTYVDTEVDSFVGLSTNGATSTFLNVVTTAVGGYFSIFTTKHLTDITS